MVHMWVASKTVWCPCYIRVIGRTGVL